MWLRSTIGWEAETGAPLSCEGAQENPPAAWLRAWAGGREGWHGTAALCFPLLILNGLMILTGLLFVEVH